jgi:hypothetical protein
MHSRYLLVALPSPLPHGVANGIVEPAVEILTERQVLGVED